MKGTKYGDTGISKQWFALTFIITFASYWMVNLLLWYPWSISSTLGITLMLTVSPIFWGYMIYKCLKKYSSGSLIKGALWVSLIFIFIAIVGDYLFFGIIRNAMTELYQPTTFYGYVFLFSLPYIVIYVFPKKLRIKEGIRKSDFITYGMAGLFSILVLAIIIRFNITI